VSAVTLVIGSLNQGSLTRRVAHALVAMAAPELRLDAAPIGHLKFYNPLLDATPLPEWTAFRETIQAADAVLFVTPATPGPMPGVIRNAIDIAARPLGQSALQGKPSGVVRVGPGPQVAAAPGRQLLQSLQELNAPTLVLAEACEAHTPDPFDAQGQLTDGATREFLARFVGAFSSWIELHRPGRLPERPGPRPVAG
jgi:chromate reductase, NAD(P)H dehydrogenase (quinone)